MAWPDDVFTYRDLAGLLREQIRTGEIAPGDLTPSTAVLMHRHSVGREVVRQALQVLRTEGLVDVEYGIGHRVRPRREKEQVRLQRGSALDVRMPTPEERRDMEIGEGVPLVEVTDPADQVRLFPGDRYRFTFR